MSLPASSAILCFPKYDIMISFGVFDVYYYKIQYFIKYVQLMSHTFVSFSIFCVWFANNHHPANINPPTQIKSKCNIKKHAKNRPGCREIAEKC